MVRKVVWVCARNLTKLHKLCQVDFAKAALKLTININEFFLKTYKTDSNDKRNTIFRKSEKNEKTQFKRALG
jgi:hypothetical protein